MVFDRVIVGVDGSPAGFEALRQASALRAPDGEMLALIVRGGGLLARGAAARRVALGLEETGKRTLTTVRTKLEAIPSSSVELVRGKPGLVLLSAVDRLQADLLVVGSHGLTRAAGIALGSAASELLHRAPCSVLIARALADGGRWVPRAITVGVDGSAHSFEAFEMARTLGGSFGASLRLLACIGGKPVDVDGLSRIDGLEWDERQSVDALVAAAATSDLVVVGSRGLHGLASLGSVSERVAHRAACSVLVVRGANE